MHACCTRKGQPMHGTLGSLQGIHPEAGRGACTHVSHIPCNWMPDLHGGRLQHSVAWLAHGKPCGISHGPACCMLHVMAVCMLWCAWPSILMPRRCSTVCSAHGVAVPLAWWQGWDSTAHGTLPGMGIGAMITRPSELGLAEGQAR